LALSLLVAPVGFSDLGDDFGDIDFKAHLRGSSTPEICPRACLETLNRAGIISEHTSP
jgi:hypothetical protein